MFFYRELLTLVKMANPLNLLWAHTNTNLLNPRVWVCGCCGCAYVWMCFHPLPSWTGCGRSKKRVKGQSLTKYLPDTFSDDTQTHTQSNTELTNNTGCYFEMSGLCLSSVTPLACVHTFTYTQTHTWTCSFSLPVSGAFTHPATLTHI